MVDIAADGGWIWTALGTMHLVQMVSQGRLLDDPPLGFLPGLGSERAAAALRKGGIVDLAQLLHAPENVVRKCLQGMLSAKQLSELQANPNPSPSPSPSPSPKPNPNPNALSNPSPTPTLRRPCECCKTSRRLVLLSTRLACEAG